MFVRVKRSNNRKVASVQIVEGSRDKATGNVKQTVIKHIGSASSDEEIAKLVELGEFVKAEIESEHQQNFFTSSSLAKLASESRTVQKDDEANYKIDDIRKLEHESRSITGIEEIYGKIYENLGFDKILYNPARQVYARNIIRHMVLGRIANPTSKRETVRFLEEDYGVQLKLDGVYSTMDRINERAIDKIQTCSLNAATTLFPEKIDILFYDATTLYFESFTEDELRSKGFSKEHKFNVNETQILLSIFVTKKGIPVGYEVFPGATYEGHTLIKSLENLKNRFSIDNIVFVADSGMLNEENLSLLDGAGYKYIVGARIKNMEKIIKDQILDLEAYQSLTFGEEKYLGKIIEITPNKKQKWSRNLVVTYSEKRAYKDEKERTEAISKLKKKLNKSGNIKSMIGASGYKKFLKIEGDSSVAIDLAKLELASIWDGLHGVVTNIEDPNISEIISHYRGLWQVEETFRVCKHDLKIRPIYHWNPERIRAHIAICFMALTCIRHLEYRVSLREKLSPERLKKALTSIYITKLRHIEDKRLFAIPSKPSNDAKIIYKTMNLPLNSLPYLISK